MTETNKQRIARLVRLIAVTLALALGLRGLGYIGPAAPQRVPDSLNPLEGLLPLQVWAVLCFVIAATVIAGVLYRRAAYIAGMTAYCAITGAWIASYATAWAFGYSDRAWITALNYCPELVAAIVLLIIGPARPLLREREHG